MIHASKEYRVLIGRDLLPRAGALMRPVSQARNAVVVSGERVYPLYGKALERSLTEAGFRVLRWIHPSGEEYKDLERYGDLLRFLSENAVGRGDLLLSLGGGVTGDLTGFAAATYLRGVDFVQIPTTLLAMVDASVGGKTAVNLPTGKNQAGCFWQPRLVICDPELLKTLPEREFRSGCAELIKCAMLRSVCFFRELERGSAGEHLESFIENAVSIKRNLVEADEFDRGERMLLNFGHSIGHAVEFCSGYTVSHGEGVSIGMAMITRAAAARGLCPSACSDALESLLRQYGLPVETEIPQEQLAAAMLRDKKRDGNQIRLVVPEDIGRCRVLPVAIDELYAWLEAGGAR